MKHRVFIILMLAVLLFSALSGCSMDANAAENALRHGVDAAGDAMESAFTPASASTPTTAALTREEAEAIALENAKLSADQVTGLRTEYEIDDGVPRYEVKFRHDRFEYDYEIHAITGAILSYDRDD